MNLRTLDFYLTGKLNAEQPGNLDDSSSLDAIIVPVAMPLDADLNAPIVTATKPAS
jgi:hypothetical protein